MEVEPRLAETGFIFRWMEQSLRLILRNPLLWVFVIFISFGISLIPMNIFFKSFFGLWLMLLGIEVAVLSDANKFSFKGFLKLFGNATEGFLFQIYFKIIFYCLMFLLYAGITLYIDNLEKNITTLSSVCLTYGLGLLSLSGVGFQIYTHLYSKFFKDLDKRSVNYNCRLASKLNYKVEIFFELYIVVNIFLISMVFPNLFFILYPISCAFIYISFREIFLGKKENGLLEENFKLS